MKHKLNTVYKKLHHYFGPQHWWPGESPFEVVVGAILTQNTSWSNVEKAITRLKKDNLLTVDKLYRLPEKKIASLITSAGYYNIKAKRLKHFLRFLFEHYQGSLKKMSKDGLMALRAKLLSVNGIGPETADSILLYALNKPIFVIDAYTKRIFSRHHLISEQATYQEAQILFMRNLKKSVKLFNEYHALLVRLGKEYCLKNKPKCDSCPLEGGNPNAKI